MLILNFVSDAFAHPYMWDAFFRQEEGFERKTLTALDTSVFFLFVYYIVIYFQTLREFAQAHLTTTKALS